jgi:hypothetical protein
MSLHVHEMAIAAERNLLPTQAALSWQIEEAATVRKQDRCVVSHRLTLLSRSTLVRLGEFLRGISLFPRQAGASAV